MAPVLTRTFIAACLVALFVIGCTGDDDTESPGARPTLTDPAGVPTVIPNQERDPYRLSGDDPLPPGATEQPTVVPERPAARTYIVLPGDTCGGIATEHGITVPELLSLNPGINEDCTNLRVDESLNIPPPSPSPTPEDTSGSSTWTYIVLPGDTCAAIAQDNDLPLQTFMAANELDEESCLTLQVGQEVMIPE